MVVENKIEKLCCFYVSDFHLEMILLPYINKKIEENIIIKTQRDLKDTVNILVSRMNLNEKSKEKILSLGWNGEENEIIEDKSNVIIIGNRKYIEDVNSKIRQEDINVTIVDCYNFEDTKDEMNTILNKYSNNLNTTEIVNIEKL